MYLQMMTSAYQTLKIQVVDLLHLSKDAIHIHIGLAVFVVATLFWQKGKVNFKCFLPVLLVALTMESIDLYDDYHSIGDLNWVNSLHDVINTSVWPFVIALLVKIENGSVRFP